MLIYFLTLKGLSTRNLSHQVRWSIPSIIVTWLSVYGRICGTRCQKVGATVILDENAPVLTALVQQFVASKNMVDMPCPPTPHIRWVYSLSVWVLLLLQDKDKLEGDRFDSVETKTKSQAALKTWRRRTSSNASRTARIAAPKGTASNVLNLTRYFESISHYMYSASSLLLVD